MNSTHQRQMMILERLRAEQRAWQVAELAAHTGVSAVTIRRDLDDLAQQGCVIRTHGGCLYAGRMLQESAYHQRVAIHYDLKRAIGRYAADQLRPNERVLIDDGSTCFHVASLLNREMPLTLYTNSMPIMAEMAGCTGIRTALLGGEYDAERQHLGGPITEWALEHLTFDQVFVGADIIDAEGRCLVQTEELASTTQAMLRRGGRRMLLADHTKAHDTAAGIVYGTLSDFDEWITTAGIAAALKEGFRKMTRITLANEQLSTNDIS